ncbi:MAG TPA: alpha/beta fold hydrolase [Polyangia bacterium]
MARERWQLPDGEHLHVHLLPARVGQPGVLVLHGLEGSANARYVRGVLARVEAAGWNGAAFDFRSCEAPDADREGAGPLGRGLYHAGKTDDLGFAVGRLRERWGEVPFGVVGFSLGGNLLIKWLGEAGDGSPANAAVAVSVPFDLAACAAAIDAPGFWSRVYRERFLRSLRRKALRYAAAYPGAIDPVSVAACRTFAAYDDSVVARIFGFADATDYWSRCSARRFLPDVQRPTLLISGSDDPFVPPAAIPRDLIAANPRLTLALCEGGGHVGFVAGTPWRPRYAAEDLAMEFLERHFAA